MPSCIDTLREINIKAQMLEMLGVFNVWHSVASQCELPESDKLTSKT